ncbi:hypothetical protein [Streptomyces acidicola]|uniref:hypothetical protein n=1 Tax=Streptomyces acidicola TaxID=2596892 RepID=UPI00341A10DE
MNGDDRLPSGGGDVDMGGQQGDSTPSGRHFARPGADAPQDFPAGGLPTGASSAAVDVLLAAVRAGHVDSEREAQAVAAFRAARAQGAHAAHTRRRDDWRPHVERRAGRSLRATLAALLASVTLGGVAVAAIGVSSDSDGDGEGNGRGGPSSSAPELPSATPSESVGAVAPAPGASPPGGPSDHPSQAKDTEAHCRAYEKVKRRGKAMEATAWRHLIDAAGGEANVRAYCAEQLSESDGDNNGQGQGQGQGQSPGQGQGNSAGPSAASSAGGGTGGTGGVDGTGGTGGAGDPAASTGAATPETGKSKKD